MNKAIPTDALVTDEDVSRLKESIARGDLKRQVYELVAREPELAIALAHKFELAWTLVLSLSLTDQQRSTIEKELTQLAWMPVLLMDRGHRRSWDGFLPSEDVAADGIEDKNRRDNEGGAA